MYIDIGWHSETVLARSSDEYIIMTASILSLHWNGKLRK